LSIRSIWRLIPLMLLPMACSLISDNPEPTAAPTSFVPPVTPTPLVVTATPGPATATAQPTTAPQPTNRPQVNNPPCQIPTGWVQYRVVSGDTLSAIARRTGTTVNQLVTGNCLSNANAIEAGWVLYVPNVIVPTATTGSTVCTLTPRLAVSGLGRVLPGLPNALRSLPGRGSNSVVLGEIPAGAVFTVMAGPQCLEGIYWWQVNYNGLLGWTGEGQGASYWLEPYAATTCSPSPRLAVGGRGRVTPGTPNVLRSLPGRGSNSVVVGEIPGGGIFNVLAGPQCADGIYWWQVNYNGAIGWTGEGQGTTYWLEPYTSPSVCSPNPRLIVGRSGLVLPGLPNTIRSQPGTGAGSQKIGEFAGGTPFRVLAGPQCVDGINWWQVSNNEITGWTGEGQGASYWLEPLACRNSMVSRLMLRIFARVTPGTPNRMRSQPGTNATVIGEIPGGASIFITGGPQCGSEGWVWWQVNYNGVIGWTAEGDNATYWLEPLQ